MTSKGRTNAIDPMGHFWYNAKEKKRAVVLKPSRPAKNNATKIIR
jgi:hypothetical protein